jgi:hypothetical protein
MNYACLVLLHDCCTSSTLVNILVWVLFSEPVTWYCLSFCYTLWDIMVSLYSFCSAYLSLLTSFLAGMLLKKDYKRYRSYLNRFTFTFRSKAFLPHSRPCPNTKVYFLGKPFFHENWILNSCHSIYRMSKEERSIFQEVIVSVILSKMYMHMCPIPNGFQDRAISLYSPKIVDKKEILSTVSKWYLLFMWQSWHSLPTIRHFRKLHYQHQRTLRLLWGHGM